MWFGSFHAQLTSAPAKENSGWRRNLEVSASLSGSYRKWKSYGDVNPPTYGAYGYGTFNPRPYDKGFVNWATTIGAVYQNESIWLTCELGYERFKYKHSVYAYSIWGDPHWQPGSTAGMVIRIDTIAGTGNRLMFSAGVGTPLLKKSKKFNLIPRIKFTYSAGLFDRFDQNKIQITRYWKSYEHPEYALLSDTAIYPSRFLINKHCYDFTVGLILKAGPFQHWTFGLDLAYALRTSSIFAIPTYKYTDKLLFRNALVVTYRF